MIVGGHLGMQSSLILASIEVRRLAHWIGSAPLAVELQQSMTRVSVKFSWILPSSIPNTILFQFVLVSLVWGWVIWWKEELGKFFLIPFVWLVNYCWVCRFGISTCELALRGDPGCGIFVP